MQTPSSDYFNICIKVYEASDLPSSNISSFVCIYVGDQRKVTNVIKNTDKPYYNEYFVFDLYTDFSSLMSTIITVSIYERRKKFRWNKMIGCISLEVATVWAQLDRRLKSWFAITLPSDVTSHEKGFVRCEINVESSESYKHLIQLTPAESPKVVGGVRARYMVRFYHCIGLEAKEGQKDTSDAFIRVSFAGNTGNTTKRRLRQSLEWNEQVTFIELFPPLYQKVTLEIIVGQQVLASKSISLSDISDISNKGYLPTYGPTYVHLYINEFVYCVSLLMAIETEVVRLFKHLERFHGVTTQPIQPLTDNQYGKFTSFLCYGVLFDAILAGKKYAGCDVNISLSFGSIGRWPTKGPKANTVTGKYTTEPSNSNFVYLPLKEQKPCVFIRSEWPNTRHRLSNSNLLAKLADKLRGGLGFAQDLISKGNYIEATKTLQAILKTIRNESEQIPNQLSKGVTKLDSERVKFIRALFTELGATEISKNDLESLLDRSNYYLSILDTLCEDSQDSLPSLVLSVTTGQTVIGSCKINPRHVIFSKSELKRGSSTGKITSLFLNTADDTNVGRLDIWLWLGFWNDVSNCLLELPPGHENISKVVSLPLTLCYTTNQIYSAVCHIFGGQIAGGMGIEGLCDTSVRVMLSYYSRQTNTVKKSLAPTWKDTLLFENLQLYPSPIYVQEHPPSITVELWDHTTKPETLIGRTLVPARVRLQPISKISEYNLELIKCGTKSRILGVFEIIQMTNDVNVEEKSNMSRLSKVLPQFLDPSMISYRLEVVFWGIRAVDVCGLKDISQPQVIIQCGSAEVRSNILVRAMDFPNFQHDLHIIQVEMPEIKLFCPPLVLRVMASAVFVGCRVDENPHQYECQLPLKKQWMALNTHRKSFISRAKARHSSVRITMPDLIPLMEIDSSRHFSSDEGQRHWFLFSYLRNHRHFVSFINAFRKNLERLKPLFYTFQRYTPTELQEEENEEECDWWDKYSSTELKIYANELEGQQEFSGFNDILNTFVIERQIAKGMSKVAKVKVMLCLYKWPTEVPVVTTQGQDPEMGVLNQNELSERVQLLVRVYCVKAHNLHPADLNGKVDSYIEIATPSNLVSDKSNYIPKQLNPVFGRYLQIQAQFPIDTTLAIRVFDWDRFSVHDLIGETIIDLENRFYSKHRATCGLASKYFLAGYDKWRDIEKPTDILERLCNMYNLSLPQYYEKSLLVASKEFIIHNKTKNKEENQERLALMALHHWNDVPIVGQALVPEHVETRSLLHKDRPGIEQGKLEMWVDMFDLSLGQPPPAVDISPRKPQPYELRVIILNTANVPLVDDSFFVGRKHTDIFVKGWLGDPKTTQSTDVHYTSFNGEGNFNWRFIFPFLYLRHEKTMVLYKRKFFDIENTEVKIPVVLQLQVWDSDRLSENDFIGAMVMELCCMPRGARSKRYCKVQKKLTPSNSVNLFKAKHLRGWWPFVEAREGTKLTSRGFLEAEFHLLTADEALAFPAGLGRSEPCALPPPLRPEFRAKFWLAPIRIIVHLICGIHKGKVITCLVIFAIAIFVLIGIYSIPMFIIKKLIGA